MSFPSEFTEQTIRLLGEPEYRLLEAALQEEPLTSIRLNPLKWKQPKPSLPVAWSSLGYYLEQRPSFTFDPLFHAGCYYVQEASSMFLEQVIKQHVTAPVTALDMCAAPGGKSTHLLSLLPKGSLLVANEVIHSRTQILQENLTKWGVAETIVTQNDTADFATLPPLFDVILVDAPCSGEGMFRKDSGAITEWSLANVQNCCQRQQRILADSWQCLKAGGLLIYSTCTYNTEEDEKNVAWLVDEFGAEPVTVATDEAWGITANLYNNDFPVYRFFPHRTKGEGFFMAALRKPFGEDEPLRFRKEKAKKGEKPIPVSDEVKAFLTEPDRFVFTTEGEQLNAYPKEHIELIDYLRQRLNVRQAGICLGTVKGKSTIPAHSLAMSLNLRQNAFPQVALNYEQAIAYLRKEAIVIPDNLPIGYLLFTYNDTPLGFAKNVGNRANNLYPQAWRILQQAPR